MSRKRGTKLGLSLQQAFWQPFQQGEGKKGVKIQTKNSSSAEKDYANIVRAKWQPMELHV